MSTHENFNYSCHRSTTLLRSEPESNFNPQTSMHFIRVIQYLVTSMLTMSQKIAELLLDMKVDSIVSSSRKACIETIMAISRVQEVADCLGADCMPCYVEMKQIENLNFESILLSTKKDVPEVLVIRPGWLNEFEDRVTSALWDQSEKAWDSVLNELVDEDE